MEQEVDEEDGWKIYGGSGDLCDHTQCRGCNRQYSPILEGILAARLDSYMGLGFKRDIIIRAVEDFGKVT